jgi:hypothetical protein
MKTKKLVKINQYEKICEMCGRNIDWDITYCKHCGEYVCGEKVKKEGKRNEN